MPSFEDWDRKQKAVYWAHNGVDSSGRVKLSAASEKRVRWVEKQSHMLDREGNNVAIDVQCVVGEELTVGSIMAEGASDDYSSGDQLYEIIAYNETPDLYNRFKRRTVGLRKFGTSLPDLA